MTPVIVPLMGDGIAVIVNGVWVAVMLGLLALAVVVKTFWGK